MILIMVGNLGLGHYLILSAIIFSIGVIGIFARSDNVIKVFMSIELMILAVNINFVAFSSFKHELSGQIFTIIVLAIAAAEIAVGLAIVLLYFRHRNSILIKDINQMRG